MAKFDNQLPIDLRNLPSGWAHAPVNAIVVELRPGFASGKHNNEQIGVPHLRPMNISREGRLDFTNLKYVPLGNILRVRPGDVLFNNTNSRELVGKTAPIDGEQEYAFSNHMTRLRPPPSLNHRFLAYQLHFLWMAGYFRHRATQHVNQASISTGTLGRTVHLAVPPHVEQIRIVERIDHELARLDATVAALHRVQAHAREYRALLIDQASHGQLLPPLTPIRAGGKGVERAGKELLRRVTSPSGRVSTRHGVERLLPSRWTTATLDELSKSKSYGTSVKSSYDAKGPPVLRIPNVVHGRLDLTDLKFATSSSALNESKQLRPGDFLIVRTNGSKSLIGRAALVRDTLSSPHFFASYLIRFRLLGGATMWEWIALVWMGSDVRAAIEAVAWTTAGQYNVNLGTLGAIRLPIPPAQVQARILAQVHVQLTVLDKLEATIAHTLTRAAALRLAVFDRAFNGSLEPRARMTHKDSVLDIIHNEVAVLRATAARVRQEDHMAKRTSRSASAGTTAARRTLLDVLRISKSPLLAERLFERAGYSFEDRDDVDWFYEQLSSAIAQKKVTVTRKETTGASYIKALP